MTERQITVTEAILEATDQCLAQDDSVYLMGLGVSDPKGIFGTTLGLTEKYGSQRVLDMPVAENGMTGVAIGSALVGMRPIMTHQRLDFALMSVEQIVNNAAKWHYMFGGQAKVPLTIRMIIGRGWGQGPQHSQNLHALFMHIPGLKVVMPFSPYDAKGLLIASVEDDNPVIFIEHRWLHNIKGFVPEETYRVPLGKANTIRQGTDITLVSVSYMVLECLKAAELLAQVGIHVEVVDLRTVKPIDKEHVLNSVRKTGRLVVVDSGYLTGGLASEVSAFVNEEIFSDLKSPVRRVATPDCPAPTSRELIKYYYPTFHNVIEVVLESMGITPGPEHEKILIRDSEQLYDVPDRSFTGPF